MFGANTLNVRTNTRIMASEVLDMSYPPTQELLIELLILIGGGYALYTVGMAIATELDYRAVNRRK